MIRAGTWDVAGAGIQAGPTSSAIRQILVGSARLGACATPVIKNFDHLSYREDVRTH